VLNSLKTDRYDVGSTEDLENRLTEHNGGEVKAARNFRPWKIVYTETFDTRSEAIRREYQIKSWKNPDYMVKQLGIVRQPVRAQS
jgi:putative endonuclease